MKLTVLCFKHFDFEHFFIFIEYISKQSEQIKVIQNDIDATKKEALKHMEQNENLEHFKQRLSDDFHQLNKQCTLITATQNLQIPNDEF